MTGIKGQKHNPYIEGRYAHINPNDVVFTPDWLAEKIVGLFEIKGLVLEPCKGEGAFLKYLPPDTEWCEIADGRNFYDYNKKVDWIVTNPPYCFVRGEAYTKNGWKHIKDIQIGELVLSLNVENNTVEWMPVTNIIHQKYNGQIIVCSKKNTKFEVTPNHKLPTLNGLKEVSNFKDTEYIPRYNFKWNGQKIDNIIIEQKVYKIKHKHGYREIKYEEKIIDIESWVKFFGFWLADGSVSKHHHCISIKQSIKNTKMVKDILDGIGYKYNVYNNKEGTANFNIYNKQFYDYMSVFGKSYTKYIPQYIKELPINLLSKFLEYYTLGDITHCREHLYVSTVSKKLSEDLQECFLKCGVLIHFSYNKRSKLYSALSNPKMPYQIRKGDLKKEYYDGEVYCLSIKKNNTFLVRVDESVYFSGNSDYNRFLEHSFELADNIVLLVPVAKMFKSMGTLKSIFDYGGFVSIYPLPASKAGFPFGFPCAVYYLKRGYTGETKIKLFENL